jgi:hypothetical protein
MRTRTKIRDISVCYLWGYPIANQPDRMVRSWWIAYTFEIRLYEGKTQGISICGTGWNQDCKTLTFNLG